MTMSVPQVDKDVAAPPTTTPSSSASTSSSSSSKTPAPPAATPPTHTRKWTKLFRRATPTPDTMDKTDLEKGDYQAPSSQGVGVAVDELDNVPHHNPNLYDGKGDHHAAEGVWAKFDAINQKLERKLGIETRGIERVPENARTDHRLYGNTLIWLAANTVLPTFGLGILGPLTFYMNLGDSMLTILFFNAFAAAVTAFMSTFGPKLGLRQMTVTRFSWGWYGAKLVALLNCIACVGWSVVNTIGGAQALEAVSDWKISAAAGVVVLAVATLAVGLFGYKIVHKYESYSWIPTAITFLVMLGVSAKHLISLPMPVGQAEAASVLSFGGAIFGFTIGWSSLASDYNVYMPHDAKSWKVFAWTYLGLILPTVLVMWLGAAVGCAALSNESVSDWYDNYEEHELGGLLYSVLVGAMGNGGKFFIFLLVLSVVANNIINVYSMGMSISVISVWLASLPRLIWPFFITAIYIPLAIVGASHFSSSLENFLNVLGYWLAIYATVVLEEHFIFRKGNFDNYNAAETWNRSDLLPVSFAAIAAGLISAAMAVLGMAQVWFIGPVGKLVGGSADPYGGDVGFEMAMAACAITFPIFRYIELKFMRR